MAIARDHPRAVDFTCYYLPLKDKDLPSVGRVVSGLHEIPVMPWPDDDCIVFAQDHISGAVETLSSVNMMIAIVHDSQYAARFQMLPRTNEFETLDPIFVYTAYVTTKNQDAVRIRSEELLMVHITNFSRPEDDTTEQMIERRLRSFDEEIPHYKFTNEEREQFRSYWINSIPRGHECWISHKNGDRGESGQMGRATDILAYLSNIAAPCHYILETRFNEGFGQTGAMRRLTQQKPIFSVIAWSRLYREVVVPNSGGREVESHPRRGHIRHHWRKAGLIRYLLPVDPIERMLLVYRRRVPRSYIPPTWVGQDVFVERDVTHRVVTEEIPLRRLWNELPQPEEV